MDLGWRFWLLVFAVLFAHGMLTAAIREVLFPRKPAPLEACSDLELWAIDEKIALEWGRPAKMSADEMRQERAALADGMFCKLEEE